MAASREDRILDAIEALSTKLDEHMTDDRASFKEHRDALFGDEKGVGLVPRMLRLEETAKTQRAVGNWLVATIGAALLTGVGTIAWALISMKAQGKLP